MPSNNLDLPSIPPQFTPLSLLRMCWKHKPGIIVVWLLVTGITVAIVFSLPAKYTAEAQVLVEAQKIPTNYVTTTVSTDIQDRLATIGQQILSTTRLQKIIDDFGLYRKERKDYVQEEILQMMRKDITVKQAKGWTNNKPGAFTVGYTGTDPAIVAQVTNRIANLYIEENMASRQTQAAGTTEFVSTELQEAKKRLDALESTITTYKQRHNGELPEQSGVISGQLSRLEGQQNANREAIARAEASKSMIENTLNLAESMLDTLSHEPDAVVPGPRDELEPVKGTMPAPPKKQSEAMEAMLAELQTRLADGHPEIKRLKLEIAKAKMMEAKKEQELAAAPKPQTPAPRKKELSAPPQPSAPRERPAVVQARERVQVLKNQIELTDKEIAARKADQEKIAAALVDYQARLTNVPVREQELTQIQRDHGNALSNYQSLLTKETSAKLATDMELRLKSERFTLIEMARVPEKPNNQNRASLNLLGSLGGLLLGLAFAIGQEFHKDVLLGSWELPSHVITLANIPRISPAVATPVFSAPWGGAKRVIVVSSALAMLAGLIVAAKLYLKF